VIDLKKISILSIETQLSYDLAREVALRYIIRSFFLILSPGASGGWTQTLNPGL
jgi:hypothetical protein